MRVLPLGDSAVVLVLGESIELAMIARVRALAAEIERHPPGGVVDIVPAFASIAVVFEPGRGGSFETICEQLSAIAAHAAPTALAQPGQTVDVPVTYGGEFGPDLSGVAAHTGLSPDEVIALHAAEEYLVHAIGFSPGFPYLGGLPARLATPRRATPRPEVPAGSVGIGGAQTGVYPSATPGGWNIIGRTPLRLFDASRDRPALLRVGDRVRFRAIAPEEFRGSPGNEAEGQNSAVTSAASQARGIQVVRGGMFTTIQDLGRPGHRESGVPLSGAADPVALRIVNSLVGNPEHSAGLEFTLMAPELKFLHDTIAAFGGADFAGVPRWRPFKVPAGTVLKPGLARSGCRGYLAVAGGIEVAPVLGSRSTYVRAQLGGLGGRALRDGDVLPVPAVSRAVSDHWRIDERILPAYSGAPTVRVILGAQASQFDDAWLGTVYKVSSRSDRMGVRLGGPPLKRATNADLLSSPVVPGTVQVPPDGQPIVLLADAQTIGGYPQLAHVISVDLPLMAQLRPGDTVRFAAVSLATARELIVAQDRAIALLREGLAQKFA